MRPSRKPRTRAAGIDRRRAAEVLARIEQDVDEPETHLRRRSQRPRMVAVLPHRTAAAHRTVEGAGAANRQPLSATDQDQLRISLDDQVEVVRLHRKVCQSKGGAIRSREGTTERAKHRRRAERGQPWASPQGDMNGQTGVVPGARGMRRRRARAARSAPRSRSASSPGPRRGELHLRGSSASPDHDEFSSVRCQSCVITAWSPRCPR
jgi:hypothetical protein